MMETSFAIASRVDLTSELDMIALALTLSLALAAAAAALAVSNQGSNLGLLTALKMIEA